MRWDRLGRIAMGGVLVALAYLYLSAGVHIFSTWRQSHRDNATVATMAREYKRLSREHESLGKQTTLEAEARRLGMARKGERPYIVSHLPND